MNAYEISIKQEINDAWDTIHDCQRELAEIDAGVYSDRLNVSELVMEREKTEREIDICTAQIDALAHALEVASNMIQRG
jgi:hypothetical protein